MRKLFRAVIFVFLFPFFSFLHALEVDADQRHPVGWLAQNPPLYETMLADPRKIFYSLSYRFFDNAISDNIGAVSLGDHIPFYSWEDVEIFSQKGRLDFCLQGAAWAIFDFDNKDDIAQIINADYLVGPCLYYRSGKVSYRLRLYHTSSHLGDEFLLANPGVVRYNPSHEAIDLFASYDLNEAMRFYAGLGHVFRSDKNFSVQPLHTEFGTELRLFSWKNPNIALLFQPFLAMHFRFWEDKRWRGDETYLLGLEISRLDRLGRKLRFYLEYHDGYSLEGQFSRAKTSYISFNMGVGF